MRKERLLPAILITIMSFICVMPITVNADISPGTIKPDNIITGVEAISIINKALGRKKQESVIYTYPFIDLSDKHWGYEMIMVAIDQN